MSPHSIPLVILLLSAAPARALDVSTEAPTSFVARSKADPDRVYALLVGATWCQPCHRLAAALAAVDSGSATAVGRAVWDKVEVDTYGETRFDGFLTEVNAVRWESFPHVIVFRGGVAIGNSSSGSDLPGIGIFLDEVEGRPVERAEAKLPSLLCPGRKDDAASTFGISGMRSDDDHSTDGFGAATLLAFVGGGSPAQLFAPSTGTALATKVSDSGKGVYFVKNPIAPYAEMIRPVALSTRALADFPLLPGRRLRLLLTGHGGPGGIQAGSTPSSFMKEYMEPSLLTEPVVTKAVAGARRNGKEVRGLVLNCFGGQFGESFMPVEGRAAPACAAFATLPEKESEGCYRDFQSPSMRDYMTAASRGLDCSAPVDGRTRHYQVVLATASRDVPMLSSEYFLLYGPGAAYLGSGDTAPAPARGVGIYELPAGVSDWGMTPHVQVYVDLIGGRVLAARKEGREIPAPRLSIEDCRKHPYARYSLDGKHAVGSFFLRSRVSGPGAVDRADCSPVVSFHWNPEDGDGLPDMTVDLDNANEVYDPESKFDGFERDLEPAKVEVSLFGLKREARVLLKRVMPALGQRLGGAALEKQIKDIAEHLRPDDGPLADALIGMAAIARADALRRRAEAAQASHAAGIAESAPPLALALSPDLLRAAGAADDDPADKEPDPGQFTAEELARAMWRNIAPGEYDFTEDISLFRLAHLTAAAFAEISLRQEAKSEPRARKLLAELESLQTCERGLY